MPRLGDVQLEAVLAAGYGVALLVVALGLEQLAHIAHRRAERFETGGFRYHAALDAWECPVGEHLLPIGLTTDGRMARYRARAATCNRCALKSQCTDSTTGRELERSLDDWPRSEITRFYRGLALVLVVLAMVVSSVGLVRNHTPADFVALGGVLVLAACAGQRLVLRPR